MHLLSVFAHPFADKYPSAVLDAFHGPFFEAGHSVEVLDLHRERFDPRFTVEDHDHYWGGPIPPEIAGMQKRVESADRLAFVFPVYWWGMPAIMKGWIERVFTGGWAYQFGSGVDDRGKKPPTALLRNAPTILIGLGSASKRTYDKYGYEDAMRVQIDVGTFSYCGITDVRSHVLHDVQSDAVRREDGLRQAREIATLFLAPDRAVRNAKDDHLSNRSRG